MTRDWKANPLSTSEHIAADIRAGRFPKQSDAETTMREIEVRNPQFEIGATIPVVERLRESGDLGGVTVVERLYAALERAVSELGKLSKRGHGDPAFDAYFRGELALRVARGEQ